MAGRPAPTDDQQAAQLGGLLSGELLITMEPSHERLYFLAKDQRLHRSKLMAWWRRGWIELEGEDVELAGGGALGHSRKRVWAITEAGSSAIESAGVEGE